MILHEIQQPSKHFVVYTPSGYIPFVLITCIPDNIKEVLKGGYQSCNHASHLDIWIFHISCLSAYILSSTTMIWIFPLHNFIQRDPWKIIILYMNAWKSNLLLSMKTNQSPYSDASLHRNLICDSTFLLLHPVFRRFLR
jgi:hypothetical protein